MNGLNHDKVRAPQNDRLQSLTTYAVVRTPEEAAGVSQGAFDYVLLCVKALPDVYDLASIIESVVSPQHTCILINTTHALGVESYLEQRFPTNVVLSLVSGAEIVQSGASEFEHRGSTNVWVGPANKNPAIPASIQADMAEALAMTLSTGQVDCQVSSNIRQQQYEKMIGPIAFHPSSVLLETPNHAELLEKVGVRSMIIGIIDELLRLATAQGCRFTAGFCEQTMETMIQPTATNSTMYQDYTAKRPMEVETYLGSPIKLAQEVGLQVPRIEALYALLHNLNIVNQSRPQQQQPPARTSPVADRPLPPRSSSAIAPRPMMNGPTSGPPSRQAMRPGSRAPSANGGPPPPNMRRGPSSMGGHQPRMMNGNGYGPRPPGPMQRGPSFEGNDLEEFSHLMLYDNIPEGQLTDNTVYGADGSGIPSSSSDLALRERELMLRQKELALREQEYHMRSQQRRVPPPVSHAGGFDDDDDDDDYFDPMASRGPPAAQIDPDNFDMMSVTSRRTRKAPSANQLRNNPEMGGPPPRQRGGWGRSSLGRNRMSAQAIQDLPGLHDSLMNNPLIGYSSDRYGNVDRTNIGRESRTNSLTAERLNELQRGGGGGHNAYPAPTMARRGSQPPGNPLSPGPRAPLRPSPPNGYVHQPPQNGIPAHSGRPSPPNGIKTMLPRHPPNRGIAPVPQQVEQRIGVSNLYPPKSGPQIRSLTGSASASHSGSGDSNRSAPLDSSGPSAHSSSSSLGPRPAIGVR
ncbi:hypothetical protein LTR66_014748 [Elasticomyces elasticus]|nr:hypothetical protein LTR66_014748 [Elasticomyces elasticus]